MNEILEKNADGDVYFIVNGYEVPLSNIVEEVLTRELNTTVSEEGLTIYGSIYNLADCFKDYLAGSTIEFAYVIICLYMRRYINSVEYCKSNQCATRDYNAYTYLEKILPKGRPVTYGSNIEMVSNWRACLWTPDEYVYFIKDYNLFWSDFLHLLQSNEKSDDSTKILYLQDMVARYKEMKSYIENIDLTIYDITYSSVEHLRELYTLVISDCEKDLEGLKANFTEKELYKNDSRVFSERTMNCIKELKLSRIQRKILYKRIRRLQQLFEGLQ